MSRSSKNKQVPSAISATVRLYFGIAVKHWRWTIPIFIVGTLGSILVFYIPPLVIADIIGSSDGKTIDITNGWIYLILFGGSWLAGEALWRLAFFLLQNFEIKAFDTLMKLTLNDLLKKDLGFYNNRFAGSITKNAIGFARRFEGFFDTIALEIVASVGPALFGLVVLFFISPVLSFALLSMMIFGAIIVKPLIKKRAKMVKEREDKHTVLAGHVADVVGNIAAVKSFGNEAVEYKKHSQNVKEFLDAVWKSWHFHNMRIDTVVSPIYVATNVIGLAIILSLGVDAGSKAALFLAFSYYATFSRFLWSFNSIYRRLEESITEASLFTAYTLVKPKVVDIPSAVNLNPNSSSIEFKDVQFTHGDGATEYLFEKLNITIPSGQKVGLVGHSGAGKSTLVGLLLRFVNIDNGQIKIGDQDISKVTQESLHRGIAYVPQDPALFHRSLRENIAYGKPNATDEEIIEASKKANALEFINNLPNGLDTMVGERGVKLSGGQRQRVAIARAILKDAPILVLDEATSALDSESEKLIQQALMTLMKDRTSIVIAHRLSTIAKLDRIIVLGDGKVVEDGSHQELLNTAGVYQKLWAHQSGGFLED